MVALAAARLEKRLQPQLVEDALQVSHAAPHLLEAEPLVGVEVEYHHVGLFERVHPAAPEMELQRVHLRFRHEPDGILHVEVRLLVAAARGDVHGAHARGGRSGMLLEEAGRVRAARASHDAEDATGRVGQHAVGHAGVVAHHVLLRDGRVFEQQLAGVRDANAVDAQLAVLLVVGIHGALQSVGGLLVRFRCGFPLHVARVFVGADALVAGVSQQAVLGPFGEFHLHDRLGVQPYDALARARLRRVGERRVRSLEAFERGQQLARGRFAQSRAHASDVREPAVLVLPQQERADPAHALGGLRVSADDEFPLVSAFQLDPVSVANAAVRRIGPLAHHAFEMLLAGGAEAVRTVAAHVHAVAQVVGRVAHQRLQQLLALGERPVAQIVSLERQQVERHVGGVLARRVAQEVLQRLEIGLSGLVGYHELAVEHHRSSRRPVFQGARDGGKVAGVVVAVARDEARPAAFDVCDDAVAVVLHLEQPVVAGRRRAHQLGQLDVHVVEGVRGERLVFPARDLVHGAPGSHGRFEPIDAGIRAHVVVLLLDEQPVHVALALLRLHMHEHPGSFQAMPVQREFQVALAQPLLHVHKRLPPAFVPQHDGAAAVFALRDGALEGAVVQRMVLHAHGQPLIAGVVRRTFGNGPAQQRPVPFEAQVVVVARGQVVLHREAQAPVAPAGGAVVARRCGAGRLGRPVEVALAVVVVQRGGHGHLVVLLG